MMTERERFIAVVDNDILRFKPMIIGKECKEDIVKGQPLFWNNF